jgi:hypothetical protein
VVEAVTPSSVQVIVAVPVASAEAIPWGLTLTIFVSDEDQQADGGVAILPLLSVAEAVSCSVPPTVRKTNCGTTANEVTCGSGGGGGGLAAPHPLRRLKLLIEIRTNKDFFIASPQDCIRETRARFVSSRRHLLRCRLGVADRVEETAELPQAQRPETAV